MIKKHGRMDTKKRGATGSGYALTVGLISIVALTAVTTTGGNVTNLFGDVGDTLIEVAAVEFSISPGTANAMHITSGPAPAYSAPVVFTVRNTGNTGTGTLSSSVSSGFQIDSDTCDGNRLQASKTCEVTVSAVASVNGPYTGTLTVGTSVKSASASLSGEASGLTPAAISVNQPTVSGMDVTGPGSPAQGTPVTLVFTNDGDVETATLTTGNTNATNFAITSDTCNGQTLTSAATCAVEVTPQATSGGSITADISVGDGSVSATSSLSGTSSGFAQYSFGSSHTFTNCGQSGHTGPSLSQCRSAYSPSSGWDNNTSYFNVSGGIQLWTVPETGTYRITASGAGGGGSHGGRGAEMRGDFNLIEGQIIHILVGQTGQDSNSGGGGGGGTYVVRSGNDPLVVAGGGGASASSSRPGGDAVTGVNANDPSTQQSCGAGRGGDNGGGGGGSANYGSAGGGGYYTNGGRGGYNGYGSSGGSAGTSSTNGGNPGGTTCPNSEGRSFLNGGTGGHGSVCYSGAAIVGGFGGGGRGFGGNANGGGGGGWSGGAGGHYRSSPCGGFHANQSTGGASYNVGSNQSNAVTGATANNHGSVTIQKL